MTIKQKFMKYIPASKMEFSVYLIIFVAAIFVSVTMLFAQQDPIYEKCMSQKERPAPWCYQEEVEKIGDPELCENILKYWPIANGVHGECYYRLALKQKDCSLCSRIHKKDIRKLCVTEVCKPRKGKK